MFKFRQKKPTILPVDSRFTSFLFLGQHKLQLHLLELPPQQQSSKIDPCYQFEAMLGQLCFGYFLKLGLMMLMMHLRLMRY